MTSAPRGRRGRAAAPAEPSLSADGQLELVRPPAPGRLELVREFLNTLDVDRSTDALATPGGLEAWLRSVDLVDPKRPLELGPADATHARSVRENLRALVRRNNALPCDCSTDVLEEAGARSGLTLAFEPERGTSSLRPTAAGLDGALGRILAAVHVAMLDGTWQRLKACADETCAWSYYDRSKNGCSRWCGETCLNRDKVKRYRERQGKRP